MAKQRTPSANQSLGCGILWSSTSTLAFQLIWISYFPSFYVGDAAGRKDDHSDADIKFAQAVGLKFYVPEEYFDVK
ncbi:hypothetical protein CsSME_00026467 [Camellia sinensis var. sinensis]